MERRVLALLTCLIAAASCSNAKQYEMRGQILAVNRDKMEILVKHEEIAGLMPAMTMPWKVQSTNMLDNLGPGDLITSELIVENNQGVVTKITKVGTAEPDLPAPAAPAKPGVKYLAPGDTIPNQVFVDHTGRTRNLEDLRGGRAMAVTFIYTKCPVPTFCPMMDRQFAETQALIKAKALQDRVRLLSVSFDPEHDTPSVLSKHGKTLGFDPDVWTLVTAKREEIDPFAASFGVTLVRGEAPNPWEIGHTLRTAVIGRDGRLVKTYSGGDWTPSDLVADLESLP